MEDCEIIEKKSFRELYVTTRMYLTHTNVGVQGILDIIEIKGR